MRFLDVQFHIMFVFQISSPLYGLFGYTSMARRGYYFRDHHSNQTRVLFRMLSGHFSVIRRH